MDCGNVQSMKGFARGRIRLETFDSRMNAKCDVEVMSQEISGRKMYAAVAIFLSRL